MKSTSLLDFQEVLDLALKGRHTSIFTQGFDGALRDGMEENAGKYIDLDVSATVNALILFTIKPPCGYRHELTRLPEGVLDLSSDPGTVYPPLLCPLRATHIGCGHPEQNGLLWLIIRGIILSGEKDRSGHFLAPLIGIMRQDAMFGLMVQMGEQISPMESGGRGQQASLTGQVFEKVGELITKLKGL